MKKNMKSLTVAMMSPGWPCEEMNNGIVSYVAQMVDAVNRQGSRVIVLTSDRGRPFTDDFVCCMAPNPSDRGLLGRLCRKLGRRLRPHAQGHIELVNRLRASIAELVVRYDVDLFEAEETWGCVGILAKTSPIPIVVRLHGPWFLNGSVLGIPRDRSFEHRVKMEGIGIKAAHGVSSPSVDMLLRTREFYDLPLRNARVLPNPVALAPDVRPWNLESSDPKTLLFVGRFDRHKGGDLAILAFNQILDEVPDARLLFVGHDRGLIDDLGRRCSFVEFVDAAIPDPRRRARVEFLGVKPQDELRGMRQRAMVTIIASRYENFAYTGLEAVAMGCPVVCARTGGMPEMFRHEENGLLFEPGNAGDLAQQCLRILKSPELAVSLSKRCLERAEGSYHPSVLGEQVMDFYREVLGQFHS